jgi:hypothetical protein
MRLFEFDDADPLRVKLMAVSSQLESEHNKTGEPLALDTFLRILRKNGVDIDESDIYDVIKKEPLVNIIDGIENHMVVFKGDHIDLDSDEPDQDDNEKIVQQMASKQASKQNDFKL